MHTLEKPNTDTFPTLPAIRLEIGDTLLNDDGTIYAMVLDSFTDDRGTWLETDRFSGYVSPLQQFKVEYNSYEL